MKKTKSHVIRCGVGRFSLAPSGIAFLTLWASAGDVVGQTYTITDLGTLGGPTSAAFGINQRGQVVGRADTRDMWCTTLGDCAHFFHGFLWTPAVPNGTSGTIQDLGGFQGPKSDSVARRINIHGAVVGTFLWENGRVVNQAPDSTFADLNDSGQVLGPSPFACGDPFCGHPFLWQDGLCHDLGIPGVAVAINGFGQVIGWRTIGTTNYPFLWTPSTPNSTNGSTATLNYPWFSPTAINSRGQIVGVQQNAEGNVSQWRAMLWTPMVPNGTNGSMTDLGSGIANGINTTGQVVGQGDGAFVWDSAQGRRDLNSLIPPGSGWILYEAQAINDSGQIVGTGGHAFLLTPLPVPRLAFASTQPNGQFRFTLVGEAGRSYTIQSSTNLVNWIVLTNFVSVTGTNQFTDTTAPNFSRRFYRAVTP